MVYKYFIFFKKRIQTEENSIIANSPKGAVSQMLHLELSCLIFPFSMFFLYQIIEVFFLRKIHTFLSCAYRRTETLSK